jgi:phosphatidylglycerol---prolipoprotein diacylglyceryl transferase
MRQVLVRIPLQWLGINWEVPVFGFGTMLVVALFLGVYLASRRARREGIAPEHIQDVAFYVVLAGIVGARIVYMIQYRQPWQRFLYFWEGGLVFYGSLIGGLLGYLLAYRFVLAPNKLSAWKLADIVTPSLALGLALGRVGCLLNGCCFGGVACPDCASLQFPALTSMASYRFEPVGENDFVARGLVPEGLQTAGGFTLRDALGEETIVGGVVPGSPADQAGLKPGDRITGINEKGVNSLYELEQAWPRDRTDLTLTVLREDGERTLATFTPRTLALHPTQIYESISMVLLFCLLMAYYPFRRHDGEVFALFLTCYPVHRFLNEMLRHDTEPVAFGMTLSQNISLLVLLAAAALWIFLLRKPAQYPQPAAA